MGGTTTGVDSGSGVVESDSRVILVYAGKGTGPILDLRHQNGSLSRFLIATASLCAWFRVRHPIPPSRISQKIQSTLFTCTFASSRPLTPLVSCRRAARRHENHENPVRRAGPIQVLWHRQVRRLATHPRSILELARDMLPKDPSS